MGFLFSLSLLWVGSRASPIAMTEETLCWGGVLGSGCPAAVRLPTRQACPRVDGRPPQVTSAAAPDYNNWVRPQDEMYLDKMQVSCPMRSGGWGPGPILSEEAQRALRGLRPRSAGVTALVSLHARHACSGTSSRARSLARMRTHLARWAMLAAEKSGGGQVHQHRRLPWRHPAAAQQRRQVQHRRARTTWRARYAWGRRRGCHLSAPLALPGRVGRRRRCRSPRQPLSPRCALPTRLCHAPTPALQT